MSPAFLQFTLIIVASALISLVFRAFKQPAILAFLTLGALLGLLKGSLGLETLRLFDLFSDLGLTILLFLVGLELTTREIRQLGKVVLIVGLGQSILTFLAGFSVATLFGLPPLTSFYAALALTFSSTVIVIQFLSDKGDIQSLYGKITVGVLLIQDIIAVLALIFVASYTPGDSISIFPFLPVVVKTVFLFSLVIYISQQFFPRLFLLLAKDTDLIFLLSLAWALGLAAFVSSPFMGFSVEIGGFLAGMALANSAEHFQIASRMKPLRDLFILVFFVSLGMQIDASVSRSLLLFAIIFSLIVFLVKPFAIYVILSLLGYKRRTSFMVSLSLAQISEFSFVLVVLGERLGHVDKTFLSLITLVGGITMAFSTFAIHHANSLFHRLESLLIVFERRKNDPFSIKKGKLTGHAILIGYGRKGRAVMSALHKSKYQVLLVDDDPLMIEEVPDKINFLFGDINDEEIQKQSNLKNAKLVVSTMMNVYEDLALLSFFRWKRRKPKIIVAARTSLEAGELYKAGADFVLLPQHVAGEYLAGLITTKKNFLVALKMLRKKQKVWLKMIDW